MTIFGEGKFVYIHPNQTVHSVAIPQKANHPRFELNGQPLVNHGAH